LPGTPYVKTRGDIRRLFTTRIIRLFCYGFLSVMLALYLIQVGLSEQQVGLLFTLTLMIWSCTSTSVS